MQPSSPAKCYCTTYIPVPGHDRPDCDRCRGNIIQQPGPWVPSPRSLSFIIPSLVIPLSGHQASIIPVPGHHLPGPWASPSLPWISFILVTILHHPGHWVSSSIPWVSFIPVTGNQSSLSLGIIIPSLGILSSRHPSPPGAWASFIPVPRHYQPGLGVFFVPFPCQPTSWSQMCFNPDSD